jgi:hypothetical protein
LSLVMKSQQDSDRRQHARYPLTRDLRLQVLPLLRSPGRKRVEIQGRVHDIGAGGLYLTTSHPMDVDRPVLCGMPLSAVPVKIPILMQVRWAEKTSAGDRFRVGLQFLL